MKEIPLTQDKIAIVDDNVYDKIMIYKWCAHKSRHVFYASRGIAYKCNGKFKTKCIKMHRFVYEIVYDVKLLSNQQIDHIDGNGLNNAINNLRLVSGTINCINKSCKCSKSGFRGVYKEFNKYKAQIQYNCKMHYIGLFSTAEQAAHAYDTEYRKIMHDDTRTNFKSPLGWCFITV